MSPKKAEWKGAERRQSHNPNGPMWQWKTPREKASPVYTRESDVPGYKEAVRRFMGEGTED